ncbi:unnamed protein product [Strongylus vulgaris]|uniref:Uncharacterized protein n=1 Tax=Strongylus vulgaris TaxID=40348 RepID=A0A3P7J292_STRVU|nr:unnamed protein product [Strongylus vulgaris]
MVGHVAMSVVVLEVDCTADEIAMSVAGPEVDCTADETAMSVAGPGVDYTADEIAAEQVQIICGKVRIAYKVEEISETNAKPTRNDEQNKRDLLKKMFF